MKDDADHGPRTTDDQQLTTNNKQLTTNNQLQTTNYGHAKINWLSSYSVRIYSGIFRRKEYG